MIYNMSQTIENSERKPWILVSSLNENTNEDELARIVPNVNKIVDDWQAQGKIMWSGPFTDKKTSMAIFEAK